MLESRVDFLFSISIKQDKEIVKKKFIQYCEAYDNLEREPTIRQKVRHREMFEKYAEYMEKENEKR
jgi:hypothetical protein